MADGTGNNAYGQSYTIASGPFAGWLSWGQGQDPYETLVGPFCYRIQKGGAIQIAFQPEARHLNGARSIHGGCLMSFADFALFAIAHHNLQGGVMAVTLTCNTEFLGAGNLDGWVEARGEVLKETRSLIFVRGTLHQRGEPILAFSGTLKKIKPSPR
jgi:acyl-coenzyme A thioesterase 13